MIRHRPTLVLNPLDSNHSFFFSHLVAAFEPISRTTLDGDDSDVIRWTLGCVDGTGWKAVVVATADKATSKIAEKFIVFLLLFVMMF